MNAVRIPLCMALAALLLGGLARAAEPLSNTGMSDSYVSDQPPQLTACQAATLEPGSGHSGGKGAAPCPLITTVINTQGLSTSQLDQSLASGPRVISDQELAAQRQLFDVLVQAAAALSGVNASVQTPFGVNGGNPGGSPH